MKSIIKHKISAIIFIFILSLLLFSCSDSSPDNSGNANDDGKLPSINDFQENYPECAAEYLMDGNIESYFIDTNNDIHLIISQAKTPMPEYFYAVYDGSKWEFEQILSGHRCWSLSMFVDDEGTVHIAHNYTGSLFYSRRKDGDWITKRILSDANVIDIYIYTETNEDIIIYYVNKDALYESRKIDQKWVETLRYDGVYWLRDIAIDSNNTFHAIFEYKDDPNPCLYYINSETWEPECVHECTSYLGFYQFDAKIAVDGNNSPIIAIDYETADLDGDTFAGDVYLYQKDSGKWKSKNLYGPYITVEPFVDVAVQNKKIYISFCETGWSYWIHSYSINNSDKSAHFPWARTRIIYLSGLLVDKSNTRHFFYRLSNNTNSDEEDGIYHATCK